MQFALLSIFTAFVLGLDQFTKYITVTNIPLHGHVDFIPGFLSFTYYQNTGAAFSALRGMQWLFLLIFVVLTVAIAWEYFKSPMPFTKFERWCIASIYAGGLGFDWEMTECCRDTIGKQINDLLGCIRNTGFFHCLWIFTESVHNSLKSLWQICT